MNKRTKNLFKGKLTGRFLGLAVALMSFNPAFAASYSSAGPEYCVSAPERSVRTLSSGSGKTLTSINTLSLKLIPKKFKIEVLNGGCGLIRSAGILSDRGDTVLIYEGNDWAGDYDITYPVREEDYSEWMWVRWAGRDLFNRWTYIKGKFCPKNTSTIKFDYNGYCNVKSGTISGFTVTGNDSDWTAAMKRVFYQQ